jgi:hypothetical protein
MLYRIRVAIILMLTLILAGCSKTPPPTVKKNPVTRISIHSIGWSVLTYQQLSCDDLKSSPDSIIITDSASIDRLCGVLIGVNLRPMPDYKEIDPRICCLYYDSSGTTLHTLSFARPPIMKLDGICYERDSTIFESVLTFLPPNYLKT